MDDDFAAGDRDAAAVDLGRFSADLNYGLGSGSLAQLQQLAAQADRNLVRLGRANFVDFRPTIDVEVFQVEHAAADDRLHLYFLAADVKLLQRRLTHDIANRALRHGIGRVGRPLDRLANDLRRSERPHLGRLGRQIYKPRLQAGGVNVEL